MYKYGVTPLELKTARKFIIQDLKSGYKVTNPIMNMTLRMYLDVIKECMLGATNDKGQVIDQFGDTWFSEKRKMDIRNMSSVEIAKDWMDGRGLFSEHFNGNNCGNVKFGDWENIADHEQNKWYHENRLDDPLWFKQCTQGSIGAGGHPCECLGAGSIYPIMHEENKWHIKFGVFSRSHFYTLKAYLHLKNKNIPVFIQSPTEYLTKKQSEQLNGCIF